MGDSPTPEQLERRKSLRLDMEQELVSIHWQDYNDNKQSQRVICIDVCNGGISVSAENPFSLESTIEVNLNPTDSLSPMRAARVMRCEEQESGYFHIGLMFVK